MLRTPFAHGLAFGLALLGSTALTAQAAETRGLDAHVHGAATLDIAVDGDDVSMRFRLPGADGVGFERAARTDEERAAIESVEETLSDPIAVFGVPAAAGCEVVSADVAFTLDDHAGEDHDGREGHDHGDEDHGGGHSQEEHGDKTEAAHAGEHDHGHGDHDKDHGDDDDHDHAEDHGEHDHEDEPQHAEFVADYTLDCATPDALDTLDVTVFERFETLEGVAVQAITPAGQTAIELTGADAAVDLPR